MKTSTSWLYAQLKHHPDVWLSPIKELQVLDYLDESADRPTPRQVQGYQRKLFQLRATIDSVLKTDQINQADVKTLRLLAQAALPDRFDFDWYRSFFEDAPDNLAVVEIAPTYAYANESAIARFAEVLGPSTKILFVLRHPVERWLSLARFDLKMALNLEPTEETLPLMADMVAKSWRKHGGYQDYIERWERHFSDTSFVYQEDLHDGDASGLKQVCDIVGVQWNPALFPHLGTRINTQGEQSLSADFVAWVTAEREQELQWLANRFGGRAQTWLSSPG